ncbi:MAG: sigma 54-interacting transcriptional regulator [Planctomycetota bacterium]|jgi:hypothetical protein|nr:sigma 54-interacting transcriptional regulator [Planctomycetota bacterium]MDP6838234.1 sigma 54-interacting transcriptional regulator [Planctomycetota bacterium]MDP6957056.1 sigma 54-interacting transcriptional regulator [Planctomycetota bacterium]
MRQAADDPLDLLLPEADSETRGRVRRVTTFLRLLTNDRDARWAAPARVNLELARHELEIQGRRRVLAALTDLLIHHVNSAVGADSFLWCGEAGLEYGSAWRVLADHNEDLPVPVEVPGPGEGVLSVAERLLEAAATIGLSSGECELWRARLEHAAAGLAGTGPGREGAPVGGAAGRTEAEEAFGKLCDVEHGEQLELAVAGLAECLLDRGAVSLARRLLEEHGAADGAPRLRRLAAWSELLAGDPASARELSAQLPAWDGRLPGPLADLRSERPEWLPLLSGRRAPPSAGWRPPLATDGRPPGRRLSFGASAFVVVLFRKGARDILHSDLAPALAGELDTFIREREGTSAVPGEAEHELVTSGRALRLRRGQGGIRAALARTSAKGLALMPILDGEGEVAGWLHLETEHHLLPSQRALENLAAAWRRPVLEALAGASPCPGQELGTAQARRQPPADPREEVFRSLIPGLALKTRQRHWWGFSLEDGELQAVAEGGGGIGCGTPSTASRILRRVISSGGPVFFDEEDPSLSLHPKSQSGLAVPLVVGRDLVGILAVESTRARDVGDGDVKRLTGPVGARALALRLAQFRRWHLRRFGLEVSFSPGARGFEAFARHLRDAARSRAPVVLSGPQGVGKDVLARWVHFEGPGRDGPLRKVEATDYLTAAGSEGGTLVVEGLEELAKSDQARLLARLEETRPVGERQGGEADQRVVFLLRAALDKAVAEGHIRPDLAHRLGRLQFIVPPLSRRRGEIPALVEFLAARVAREEGLAPVELSDQALAVFWRQSWAGNLRQLESVVYKLVLLHHGRAVGKREILEMSQRFALGIRPRLSSRQPQREDVLQALDYTCTRGGRVNKTRAALYLGWDPDTLVVRLGDLELDPIEPELPRGW